MSRRIGSEEDVLNPVELWRILFRHKWMILAITLLCVVVAAAAAFIMTPIYRAEVLLVPSEDESAKGLSALAGQLGGLASLAGLEAGTSRDSEASMATLKSRAFLGEFIENENILPILFEDLWDVKRKKWKGSDQADRPTAWEAYKVFTDKIMSTSRDKRTGLVTLAVEWKDPTTAAQWANTLVTGVNERLRNDAVQESQRNLQYLQAQHETTSVSEVQQSLFGLIENEMKKAMLANATDEYAFRVIDPAVVPEEMSRPKRAAIIALGLLLGALIGVIIAFVRNAFSQTRHESS